MAVAMEGELVNSRFLEISGLTCAALLAAVVQAFSQAPTADFGKKAIIVEERRESVVVYPSAVSGTPLSDAGLIAGDRDKRAFINYVIRPKDAMFDVTLSASTPLADTGTSSLAQLTGLTSKTRVGVQWRLGRHHLPTPEENAAIWATLWPECEKLLAAQKAAYDREAEETGISEQGCNFSDLNPARVREALSPYRGVSWFLTVKGELGPEAFSFVDASFQSAKQREWGASGSASAGFLLPFNVYTSAGLRFERGYKAAKDQAICTADEDSRIACPLKPFGAPTEEIRKVIEAEVRSFVGSRAGVSSIVRYDWESGDKSIEVPLYLVQDKDGGLRGGVAYGHVWSSKPDSSGHQFSVFVGQTFKLGL